MKSNDRRLAMSYQITWKDFNGRERITPIFVIGKEKEAIEGFRFAYRRRNAKIN